MIQPSKLETTIYPPFIVVLIVLSTFFPSTLNDYFSLDINIRNSESISLFKSRLLSFIPLVQNNIYNIFDPEGLNFLTQLWVGLSHLNAHRFHHNFHECLNPLCSCSLEIEVVHITYWTVVISQTNVLILWIELIQWFKSWSLCLRITKKIYFYLVTHDSMKTKINKVIVEATLL